MTKSEKPSSYEEKEYQIPMIITDDAIRDFGIDPKEVTRKRIGNHVFSVIMVNATEAQYKSYMDSIWAEIKRKDREGRCLIPSKSGRLIRCPESRKCENCERYTDVCKEENRPASLSFLAESGEEPMESESFEENIIYEAILEDLIDMLDEIKPGYGMVFRLLYEGETQEEIAEDLGIKPRTLSDHVKRVRDIVQPLAKTIFDR